MNTILLYHGVTASQSQGIENYSGKHMAVDEFRRQMHILAVKFQPMSLRELATRTEQGEALPNAVAVTFDDSYKNLLENAAPILEEYRIPATFFIATGYVSSNRRYWTDRLEHIYNVTGGSVEDVKRIKARLKGEADQYGLPGYGDRLVLSLAQAFGCSLDNGNDVPNYRNMSWDDVRMLDANPLFDVGGHTVNHSIMSYLHPAYLRSEIEHSLDQLEQALGHRPDLYAYPEGQPEHFNQRVIDALRDVGVVVCPSAISGPNPPGTDPFHLRRYMPGIDRQPFPLEAETA